MRLMYPGCLFLFLSVLPSKEDQAQSPLKNDTGNAQNLHIFSSVFRKVVSDAADSIDSYKFLVTGMNQMLQAVDPYTVFFTEEDMIEFRLRLAGKFGGIGIVVGYSGEGFFIRETFSGGPAEKAGVHAADLILEVNGTSTKGMPFDNIFPLLRGAPGTPVTMIVKRTKGETVSISMKREVIQISPIRYYGMLRNQIAYIHLTRVTDSCSFEVKSILKELNDKYHFKALVFDVRGNEGGYMMEALRIANLFLPKKTLLVQERGRSTDTSYYANEEPLYPNLPLVVLTDGYTASSGEVLTGALQDNDRAVLIGQKTFGKGLIQRLFDMPYHTQLKLTTARYYTPSGRCIQEIAYEKGTATKFADSTKKEFKSKNGRSLFSNGGISPDIKTVYNAVPAIALKLEEDLMIFEFATKYEINHLSIASPDLFQLTDAEYDTFVAFVKSKKYTYQTETEKGLENFRQKALAEGYWDAIKEDYMNVKNKLEVQKQKELIINKAAIKKNLEQEIISRYYHQKGRYKANLQSDNDIKKAIEILQDPVGYNRLLRPAN